MVWEDSSNEHENLLNRFNRCDLKPNKVAVRDYNCYQVCQTHNRHGLECFCSCWRSRTEPDSCIHPDPGDPGPADGAQRVRPAARLSGGQSGSGLSSTRRGGWGCADSQRPCSSDSELNLSLQRPEDSPQPVEGELEEHRHLTDPACSHWKQLF